MNILEGWRRHIVVFDTRGS